MDEIQRRARSAAYYAANRERILARAATYYKSNRDRIVERNRKRAELGGISIVTTGERFLPMPASDTYADKWHWYKIIGCCVMSGTKTSTLSQEDYDLYWDMVNERIQTLRLEIDNLKYIPSGV